METNTEERGGEKWSAEERKGEGRRGKERHALTHAHTDIHPWLKHLSSVLLKHTVYMDDSLALYWGIEV